MNSIVFNMQASIVSFYNNKIIFQFYVIFINSLQGIMPPGGVYSKNWLNYYFIKKHIK
jgi:hypothetical protein